MTPMCDAFLFLLLVSCCKAFDLQYNSNEVQHQARSLGLEEVALFLIGLGVASILGLSIVIGPLFAMFYASMSGNLNGSNTVSTSVGAGGGNRRLEADSVKTHLLKKLTESLRVLDDAMATPDKP